MKRYFCLLLFLPLFSWAQAPHQPDAAEIKQKLNKLNFLGSVLYVAAHPDDENTRIITYMSKGRLAETAYLAMTRGDGGQNLIGPEIRDELGVIRTQELLAARRIDGGRQFFTRANDFGFSKSADETFRIWGKDEILSDVVKVYRTFQPDVIITRFPPTAQAGHGHHTASAILAQEAFDVAGNKNVFPEQARKFGTWKPVRLYTNTGRWWNNSITEDTPGVIVLRVGTYNPLLGESYTEIAARSRSQHKSQGFGSRGVRGDEKEFLEYQKGEKAATDIFEGINTKWSRVKGGEKVQALLDKAILEFRDEDPAASLPVLVQIKKEIENLEGSVWKTRKLEEIKDIIANCLGLYCEATADQYYVAPDEKVKTTFEIVNRADAPIVLESISSNDIALDTTLNVSLKNNSPLLVQGNYRVKTKEYSGPYWLKEPHSVGLFTVKNKDLIGKPQNDPAIEITFHFKIGNEEIEFVHPLVYRWTDPVKGEQYRPFEIVPPVVMTVSNSVLIFNTNEPKSVDVIAKSTVDESIAGKLALDLPQGWKSEPSSYEFKLDKRDEEVTKTFKVMPPVTESTGTLSSVATVNGQQFDQHIETINYDHIPTQTLLEKAESKLVRIDIRKEGSNIGYIKGAGDDVPAALRNMGFSVWEMKDEEVTKDNLKGLDAVVLGVRALNTNERIPFIMEDLLDYVKEGGTLVVQYNNNFRLKTDKFSPYPLSPSRDRVTEEDAEVRILAPEHPVMNTPNKIEKKDFDGWVQERGLYFPDKWAPEFTPVLSMNDTGEKPLDGSLLIAPYGEGYYVYTGISFFRELPEGIPGAYKLFANIISLGKNKKSASIKTKKTK